MYIVCTYDKKLELMYSLYVLKHRTAAACNHLEIRNFLYLNFG